ncbi:MAG: hypothetical protein HC915_17515 [Anaerolineae bacterium]|nr:hypothetical protein [Anaerolineae bacterium]
MKKIVLSLMLVLLLAVGLVPGVLAQEGSLSEEEQALVERAQAAITEYLAAESYSAFGYEILTQDLTLNLGPTVSNRVSSSEVLRDGYIIFGEAGSAQYSGQVIYSEEVDGTVEASYTMDYELRYVNGTLYVNASYAASEGNALPLSDGWVQVDDPEAFPEFQELDLDDLLDNFDGEARAEEFARIQEAISIGTLGATTYEDSLEDGSPVVVIRLVLDAAVLAEVTGSEEEEIPAEFVQAMVDAMATEEEPIVYEFALTPDGVLAGVALGLTLDLADADLRLLVAEVPEGSLFSLMQEAEELTLYSNYGGTFDPVMVPEGME